MKLTISAPQLSEALATVGRALSARTANPILEGILFETGKDYLQITASDERITIVTRATAYIEEQGRGVVPGKLLTELVRRMGNDEMVITMNEKFQFRVSCAGSRTNIAGRDADLYPLPPMLEEEGSISLPQAMVREMIEKTEFAIAVDDVREVLTGCYLEVQKGQATMVGIDGFRMAMVKRRVADMEGKLSAIIPGRNVGDVARLLSDSYEEFCDISFERSRLHITAGRTDIYVVLIEGEFVDFNRILPPSFATRINVDIETFKRCVDRAALMAREGSSNTVRLIIEGGAMRIESNSEIGDVHEELEIEQEGNDIKIAFNVRYIIDVLKSLSGEKAEIAMNTPITPCVIMPENDRDYLHMVLPVRTQA